MQDLLDRLDKLKTKSIEMNKMLQEAIDKMKELRLIHQCKKELNSKKSKML